jgi:hypothetical protein
MPGKTPSKSSRWAPGPKLPETPDEIFENGAIFESPNGELVYSLYLDEGPGASKWMYSRRPYTRWVLVGKSYDKPLYLIPVEGNPFELKAGKDAPFTIFDFRPLGTTVKICSSAGRMPFPARSSIAPTALGGGVGPRSRSSYGGLASDFRGNLVGEVQRGGKCRSIDGSKTPRVWSRSNAIRTLSPKGRITRPIRRAGTTRTRSLGNKVRAGSDFSPMRFCRLRPLPRPISWSIARFRSSV